MTIQIIPYEKIHEKAVCDFNARLRQAGMRYRFSESHIPFWLPSGLHDKLYNKYFIAQDDEEKIRGVYILKYQDFHIGEKDYQIAHYTYPISEGIFDKKYALVAVQMLLDAQNRMPYLYDLGYGSKENPTALVQQGFSWSPLEAVPFYLYVNHPYKFFRNYAKYSNHFIKNLSTNMAACSGLGWCLAQGIKTFTSRNNRSNVNIENIDSFGPWANELWNIHKNDYHFIAVRDSSVLNVLYPTDNERFIKLKIYYDGKPRGWAVLLNTRMNKRRQFGDMQVGTIVDCFSSIEHAPFVLKEATNFLRNQGADIVISYLSNHAWKRPHKKIGFMLAPTNSFFSMSKELALLAKTNNYTIHKSFLNLGDGDGPLAL